MIRLWWVLAEWRVCLRGSPKLSRSGLSPSCAAQTSHFSASSPKLIACSCGLPTKIIIRFHVNKMVLVHQEIRLRFRLHLLYSLDDSDVSARLSSFNFRSLCLIRFVIDLVCSSVLICRVSLSEKKESLILCMWSLWRFLTIDRKCDLRQIWGWLNNWLTDY